MDETAIKKAIEKALAEYRDFDGEDYIGNRGVFILWQHLGCIDMPNDFTLLDYKPIVQRWYEQLEGCVCDEYGELLSFTEVWAQFVDVCGKDRVKFFKHDYLELAKERARQHAQPLPEFAEFDEAHQYLRAVCYELQRIAGENDFWLSSYDAGKILGKCQKKGLAAMNMFVAEGILERTKVGNRYRASEYRYTGKPPLEAKPPDKRKQKTQKMIKDLMHADRKAKASKNK